MTSMVRLSLWLALASAGSILISIAASEALLALALGVLLLSGLPLQWPRIAKPLGLFLASTLLSLAFSPDPGFGMAQVRKMFVFLTLLVIFSSIRTVREARWLTYIWMAIGTFTAAKGLVQFARDIAAWAATAGHEDFYHFYIADRIRGFMSHWMTFSGQELFVLLMLAAFLLFGPLDRWRLWIWLPCCAIVATALVLSNTRGVWIAAIVAGIYLLWQWRKQAVLAIPFLVALVIMFGPAPVRERINSLLHPHGTTDSNEHRLIVWSTGWEMIKAHPLLGVGPDMVRKKEVQRAYLPKWVSLPLPEGFYEHAHNFYIQYAAERGIPATLFIVAALALSLYDFTRALKRLPPGRSTERYLLQAAIAFIIGTAVGGITEYNLNDSEVLTMFLTMMCLGYTAASPHTPQSPAPV
jgi:putative inorganic carbon (HCO3(-)) transporter